MLVMASCESKKKDVNVSDSTMVKQIPADAPDWYRDPPHSQQYVYGKGMAVSRRINIARDKAILLAQAELAEKIGTLVIRTEDVELEQGIIKEQKQTLEGDHWRVYVLLEMAQ